MCVEFELEKCVYMFLHHLMFIDRIIIASPPVLHEAIIFFSPFAARTIFTRDKSQCDLHNSVANKLLSYSGYTSARVCVLMFYLFLR